MRVLYVDLDGTLLGPQGALFRAEDGSFSLLAARALEACARAGVEVVPVTGRRRASVVQDARMLGCASFACEAGGLLVVGGEEHWLTEPFVPGPGETVHGLIGASGAVELLRDRFGMRPFELADGRPPPAVTHLLVGSPEVDVAEVEAALEAEGIAGLRVVDNGAFLDGVAIHLVPASTSKARAVAAHLQVRGLGPDDAIAVGDSREDVGMADAVGTFWLVANADPEALAGVLRGRANVRRCAEPRGAGVYEAVVTTLAERRG